MLLHVSGHGVVRPIAGGSMLLVTAGDVLMSNCRLRIMQLHMGQLSVA